MTTKQSVLKALENFDRISRRGGDALIVERTDHPEIDGSYFYAIKRSEKRLWTVGETQLTQDQITDLWYSVGCPPSPETRDYFAGYTGIRIVDRNGNLVAEQ